MKNVKRVKNLKYVNKRKILIMSYVIYDTIERKYIAQSDEAGFYQTPNLCHAEFMIKKPTMKLLESILNDIQEPYENDRYKLLEISMSINDSEGM